MIPKAKIFVFLILITTNIALCQDETDYSKMYTSWALIQTVPSPVTFHDSDGKNGRLLLGLRWQLIPLNISFRANKYISPVQFFMINPVRRFTGSMEIFVQPEWSLGAFKYAGLNRFGISAGSRIIFPVKGMGQNISASIGGKYNYREDLISDKDHYYGIELGIYAVYGLLGLQFNYNFDTGTKYNIGLFFKYF